jgi:hypothetical protein
LNGFHLSAKFVSALFATIAITDRPDKLFGGFVRQFFRDLRPQSTLVGFALLFDARSFPAYNGSRDGNYSCSDQLF